MVLQILVLCPILLEVLGISDSGGLVRRHATVDNRGKPRIHDAKTQVSPSAVKECSTFEGQTFDCSKPPEGSTIPKVVHFMYKTKIVSDEQWPNLVWKFAFEAWKKHFPEPDFKYMFWDEDTINKQFKTHCSQHFELYQSFASNISRSDLSRYCLLHEIGGIYADLDYEPRDNFYKSFSPGKVNLLESPYNHEILQNSLMASPPGQEFWLDLLKADKHRKGIMDPTSATGPHVLDQVAFQFLNNDMLQLQGHALRGDVNMLPCKEFQRRTHVSLSRAEERLLDKMKPGCSLLNLENYKAMKGIHWGTLSWRTGKFKGKVDIDEIQVLWGAVHGTWALMNGNGSLF